MSPPSLNPHILKSQSSLVLHTLLALRCQPVCHPLHCPPAHVPHRCPCYHPCPCLCRLPCCCRSIVTDQHPHQQCSTYTPVGRPLQHKRLPTQLASSSLQQRWTRHFTNETQHYSLLVYPSLIGRNPSQQQFAGNSTKLPA